MSCIGIWSTDAYSLTGAGRERLAAGRKYPSTSCQFYLIMCECQCFKIEVMIVIVLIDR